MSMLIKGAEMPKTCSDCWALDDYGDYPRCRITGEQRGYKFRHRECRMPNCPLVPTPEPPKEDVVPVAKIEKLIESLQEQADIYNARVKELYGEEDGQVSQYTWAVSLRETYRRIVRNLDDLIS